MIKAFNGFETHVKQETINLIVVSKLCQYVDRIEQHDQNSHKDLVVGLIEILPFLVDRETVNETIKAVETAIDNVKSVMPNI